MKSKKYLLKVASIIVILFLLILDTRTAIDGATAGIELCLKVVIPSLFPFFLFTTYLNASVFGLTIPGIKLLGRLLNIPKGSDSLLLLGLIGGYPVGAQLVSQVYRQQKISRRTAEILLGYCNNAGPAFIFGMAGTLFASKLEVFVLWGIHILSALLTGFLLPKPAYEVVCLKEKNDTTIINSLKSSLNICATTCGWIIVFKIILQYLNAWRTVFTGNITSILIPGFLELSNGCLLLEQITSESIRFILCNGFLSFGGICVMMQTASVTEGLGFGLYIPGKIIQTAISIIVATGLSFVLYPNARMSLTAAINISFFCLLAILVAIITLKKYMAIPQNLMYNQNT